MKFINIHKQMLCSLFFITLLTSSCIKEKDILPKLKGIPSGGLLAAEVKSVNGDVVTFRLDMFAVNHYGDFIENLEKSCFSIDDNYPKAELISIQQGKGEDKGSYSAALLFDQSGSIEDNDPFDARVEAGKAFIDIMDTGDEVAIAAFSGGNPGNPAILHEFSSNNNSLKTVIDGFVDNEGGGTPLYNSIFNLVDYVNNNAKNSNKAIIAMTDGEDTQGGVAISTLINTAVIAGVEVYTIGLGNSANLEVLQQIALGTGGAVMQAQDAIQLISLYNSLADLLRGNGIFYETCWVLKKPDGSDWVSGNNIVTVIDLQLPTGEVIEFQVRLVIP